MIKCKQWHNRDTRAKYVRVLDSNSEPKDGVDFVVGDNGKFVWLGSAYCGLHTRNMNTNSMVTVEWVETFIGSNAALKTALKAWYDAREAQIAKALVERQQKEHEAQVRYLKQNLKLVEVPSDDDNTLYEAKIVVVGGENDGKEVQSVSADVMNGVAMIRNSHSTFLGQSPKMIDLLIEAFNKAKEVANTYNKGIA